MKAIKLSISIVLLTTLILSSCSKDEDNPITPNASDITAIIDENPTNGTSIGTVTTNLTGTLNYTITSQSVLNAFSVDNVTGVVTVDDALKFDFEVNPSLTASVTVSNGVEAAIASVNVSLNNVDDISSFLTDSQSDYDTATPGEWVTITAAEYDLLAAHINLITKTGMRDTNYDMGPANATFVPVTITNVEEPTMPIGSYVFAAKFNLINEATSDIKFKQSSTSVSSGYEDLGNIIGGGIAGDNYVVLKGSDSATTNTAYFAIYDASAELGFRSITGITIQFDNNDVNDLTSVQGNSAVFFQGLTTTQKQWD